MITALQAASTLGKEQVAEDIASGMPWSFTVSSVTIPGDSKRDCRPYSTIIVTDGDDSCPGPEPEDAL